MEQKQEAYDKPWHVYAGEPSTSTFHSGYSSQEAAREAQTRANMEAEKLGIPTRYAMIEKPEA